MDLLRRDLLIILGLVVGFLAGSAKATTFYGGPHAITATTVSTKIGNQNNARTYLLLQNTGSVSVILKFGSVQSANEGIVIVAGGVYEPIVAPANSFWIKSASSTAAVTWVEGQ